MLPTYADGDRLLALRPPLGRPVRVGDVVVVVAPAPTGAATETLVKRVSRLEPGQVFVVGDNSPSYDSNAFGPLALDAVIGRVVGVISGGGILVS
jgi:phage repressor protein C with HTH and peptisase S24 domain